jgi:ferric-dicitrate binding protein FerR (iron transport regulator)
VLNNDNHINDELLVSYLLNEADINTRQQVEEWIEENSANKRYFEHFKTIWEASKEIDISLTVNENAAWQRFQERTQRAKQRPAVIKTFTKLKVAAAIVIAFGLSYLIWDKTTSAPVTFSTANQSKIDTLPDGSYVTLNKNSSIIYAGRFKGDKRKVTLKGEAFFNVTTDKNKPFVVEVNDVTVTVLGTSFNVKNVDGNTEVVVETGVVQVKKRNRSVTLKPKEKVVIARQDTVLGKEASTDKLYNYYRTNEFVCDNTPLWKLVEVLNEAYASNIVIENEKLKNLPLTTTFYNESLDNVLNIISETFNITVERNSNKIILK